jgi:hypothetical protein
MLIMAKLMIPFGPMKWMALFVRARIERYVKCVIGDIRAYGLKRGVDVSVQSSEGSMLI